MRFFTSRWRGEVPLDRLFWRDMALIGSALNLSTTAAALVLLGLKAPLFLVLAVHFAPVPYNVFLVASIWRLTDTTKAAGSAIVRGAAVLWLVAAIVI
ncbi:MAG: hypothetical protein H0T56_09320 [Pseudaminobacter sp.]|nr:hypothetical protein [Pseudaminobacter sp.]